MKNRKLKAMAGILAAAMVLTAAGGVSVNAAKIRNIQKEAELTEEKALETARKDADLKEKEIDKSRVKLDYDDGQLYYEVEFYAGEKEYDYEIDAKTGKILSKDFEIEDDFLTSKEVREEILSESEVQKIVLKKVPGASEKKLYMKLDRDDGKWIYEGDILYKNMEYEFEIDAETGKILSWEEEDMDD
ncbi:PepSY domain-containing protein [Blautia sp. An249]|uniref:PepSY domain-containing protein n=1 Tax=Blautia sp. An249 TaxID=1965603 RepID=UPI0013A63EA2|nr:PepSY domain-containing protein [Blautia sp. An249]